MSPDVESDQTCSGRRWVLVLGGCTRPGNRRARRFVAVAAANGFDVVWFDGFEEVLNGRRVPIEDIDDETGVRIIGLRDDDETSTNRTMRSRVARLLSRRASGPRRLRLARLVKRSVQVGRGRRLRRVQMPIIDELTVSSRPTAVVYCDDLALTTAWELQRRWPDVAVGSDLVIDGANP